MLVTLFSDASMCHHRMVGGWAAWLKCNRGTMRAGAPFSVRVRDTAMAEAMAVVNGMAIGLRDGLVLDGDEILVQTDNDSVMSVLLGTAVRRTRTELKRRRGRSRSQIKRDVAVRNDEIRAVASVFSRMTSTRDLTIRWRHVKGHRGKEDARSAVNTYCDVTARDHMRAARRRTDLKSVSDRHPPNESASRTIAS
jgi:ribonuclease HI